MQQRTASANVVYSEVKHRVANSKIPWASVTLTADLCPTMVLSLIRAREYSVQNWSFWVKCLWASVLDFWARTGQTDRRTDSSIPCTGKWWLYYASLL